VLHGRGIDLHPDHLGRALREQGSPVPLTAGEVKHPLALDQRTGKQIPVIVLVDDLKVPGPGDAAFTGPLDQTIRPEARLVIAHAGPPETSAGTVCGARAALGGGSPARSLPV